MNSARYSTLGAPQLLLLSAIVVGLFARAWVIWHGPGYAFAVDELFDTLAWNLVTVHQFTFDRLSPAAHVGPLYPTLLAVLYSLVGHRPEWVPMLHVLFDLGAVWCIYRVGTTLWGSWVGAWTAALVFLYPAYWTYDPRIRSEALLTLLVSLWLWATVLYSQGPSCRRCVFVGIAAGLTVLCKPVVLILVLLLTGLIWIGTDRWSRKIVYVVVYGATCIMLVAPWSVRNYMLFDRFIPVSAGMGAGLWMGSDPASRGSWPMPPEREHSIWESAGITPLPYAHAMYDVPTDQLLREKGLTRIAADPAVYLTLTLTRVWDFWIGNSFYLTNGEQGLAEALRKDAAERGWAVAMYGLLKRLLVVPSIILMAVGSAWVHRERWRDLLPLYLFPIGLTAGYVPFTVEAGRYALPVLPCLMVLSVALVLHRWDIRSVVSTRSVSSPAMSA